MVIKNGQGRAKPISPYPAVSDCYLQASSMFPLSCLLCFWLILYLDYLCLGFGFCSLIWTCLPVLDQTH